MSDLGLTFFQAPPAPDTFNVLLYGPAGSGKSTAAATAPGPILWLNFEGPNALAHARKIAAERGTAIHEVRVAHTQDPRQVLRSAVNHIVNGAEPHCRTLVVDTIGKVRSQLAQAIGGSKPTMAQWGTVANELDDFIRHGRDMPANLILLAHEDIKDGEGDEGRITRPLIGGSATEKVVAEVDIVGYTGVVEREDGIRYMAQLVQRGGRRAKDRSGALGAARVLDLSEWLATFRQALSPDESDLPWGDQPATADDIADALDGSDAPVGAEQ